MKKKFDPKFLKNFKVKKRYRPPPPDEVAHYKIPEPKVRVDPFIEKWYKGRTCVICGRCVDLHYVHRNPDERTFLINHMRHMNEDRVQEEINKCEVLCDKCHGSFNMSNRHRVRRGEKEVSLIEYIQQKNVK